MTAVNFKLCEYPFTNVGNHTLTIFKIYNKECFGVKLMFKEIYFLFLLLVVLIWFWFCFFIFCLSSSLIY
jgi:hypothetical protein